MSAATCLVFFAGATGAFGLLELFCRVPAWLSRSAPALVRGVAGLADALVRIGREGRDPGAVERRRLLLAGALAGFLVGFALAGAMAGLGLAAGGPWLASRVLRARRERYRRAIDDGAAQMAVAIADALGGGHSLRGALEEAAGSVDGAAGNELCRAGAELAAGATTEGALEYMRARARSPRVDEIVAACLLQHRAGGDLARLLRHGARSMEEQARLEAEVRAATAQARFTGLLVALLPLGGGVLAELASPGWFAGLWSSFLTAWLLGFALILQLVAAIAMRRLGRVRW